MGDEKGNMTTPTFGFGDFYVIALEHSFGEAERIATANGVSQETINFWYKECVPDTRKRERSDG